MINNRFTLIQLFVLLFFSQIVSAQFTSISDIQGPGDASPLSGQSVNISAAVTGVFPDGYFVRDNDGVRSGIYVYDPGSVNTPLLGDTISLTAVVEEYYNFTELKTVSNFIIASTGNPVPDPVEMSTGSIDEDWEGCLVKITNAVCTNPSLGYGEWEVDDGSGALAVNDLGVAYTPETDQIYGIIGLVDYSFSAFKLEPRDLSDIEIMASHYFTKEVFPVSIEKNSLLLAWETNTPAKTELMWGTSPDQMVPLGVDEIGESHQMLIENLQPAGFYYIMPFSVIEDDTVKMAVKVFTTASESSGEIRASFNRTLNHAAETDSPELYSNDLTDSIVAYITMAEVTLDIAMYDFTNHATTSDERNAAIAEAVNSAYERGVNVRFITDADVTNDILYSTLVPEIQVLKAAHDGIMHHKFIVTDYESTDNSWVVSGSVNPNYNNLTIDYNNLIAIQDQALAKAFHYEFNEMWGDAGLIPDLLNSRFSANKIDNTPHHFSVNGKRIELYFSPSDRTTSRISEVIENAVSTVDFAMMAFTEDVLGNSVINAYNNQIEVRGIIDYVDYSGSEFEKLLNAGVKVYDYANPDGSGWPDAATVHHKFAVVDAGTENGVVITGSHNWTASAESRNDENTLIIHDKTISSLFLKEVKRIENQIFKNLSPSCVNDLLQAEAAFEINYDVLSNDIFNSNVILEIIEDTKFGKLIIEDDQTITYTPTQAEVLNVDSFSYKLSLENNLFVSDTALAIIDNFFPLSENYHLKGDEIFRVYPNPAENFINIYYDGEISPELVQVIDMTGKLVFETKNIHNRYPLRIKSQDLESGIYLIKIYLGDKVLSKKVVRK